MRLVAEQLKLVTENRFVGVNLFARAFAFDQRFHELFELLDRAALNPKSVARIGVHETHFCRDPARQAGLQHRARFRQRVLADHAGDVQADLGVAKVLELWQDGFERLLRDRTRCHPINADLHRLQPRFFEGANFLARQQETVCRQAGRKADFTAVTHQLDDVRMRQRLAADEGDSHRAEIADFPDPFLEVIDRRMWPRVVVFRAISAIEVAAIRHV